MHTGNRTVGCDFLGGFYHALALPAQDDENQSQHPRVIHRYQNWVSQVTDDR
jgi:hypothetical protein